MNEETAVRDRTSPSNNSKEQVMMRRRMLVRPVGTPLDESKSYETAMFVPTQGLMGSHLFYHNDLDKHESSDSEEDEDEEEGDDENGKPYPTYQLNEEDRVYEERTVLFQSLDHYQQFATDPHTSTYFTACLQNNLENDPPVPDAKFGEQILVQGCTAKTICIGDRFAFVDPTTSPPPSPPFQQDGLVVEVTSPRLACSNVDRKTGSPFGRRGMRRYVNTHGKGGWFARVLRAGQVRDGMIMIRTRHPHPRWTLAEVATALYGECYDPKYTNLNWAQWNRSKSELEELCGLHELGWEEWKDEAQWILDRWDTIQNERKSKEAQSNAGAAISIFKGWTYLASSLPQGFRTPLSTATSLSASAVTYTSIMFVFLLVAHNNWESVIHLMALYSEAATTTLESAVDRGTPVGSNVSFCFYRWL